MNGESVGHGYFHPLRCISSLSTLDFYSHRGRRIFSVLIGYRGSGGVYGGKELVMVVVCMVIKWAMAIFLP